MRERRRDDEGLFVAIYGPEVKDKMCGDTTFKSTFAAALGVTQTSGKDKTVKELKSLT